jgi:SAM-dependent methyltransferase
MTDNPVSLSRPGCPLLNMEGIVPDLPAYLEDVYSWAYLSPRNLALLDRPLVVSAILWGNYRKLLRATLGEVRPGQRVLQPACVYGDFSPRLAAHVGRDGYLEVADVAPIQIANCRRKLKPYRQASVRLRDAADAGSGDFDVVCCFFLLHELPDAYKRKVVDALLDRVGPGGKAVFVDYHRPSNRHPLKPVMSLVFETLEPFAKALWTGEIRNFAGRAERFSWSKRTFFAGMYQMAVARRLH